MLRESLPKPGNRSRRTVPRRPESGGMPVSCIRAGDWSGLSSIARWTRSSAIKPVFKAGNISRIAPMARNTGRERCPRNFFVKANRALSVPSVRIRFPSAWLKTLPNLPELTDETAKRHVLPSPATGKTDCHPHILFGRPGVPDGQGIRRTLTAHAIVRKDIVRGREHGGTGKHQGFPVTIIKGDRQGFTFGVPQNFHQLVQIPD